jgi:hypothetical protein
MPTARTAHDMTRRLILLALTSVIIAAALYWTAWEGFVAYMTLGFAGYEALLYPEFYARLVPPFMLDLGCLWLLVWRRRIALRP